MGGMRDGSVCRRCGCEHTCPARLEPVVSTLATAQSSGIEYLKAALTGDEIPALDIVDRVPPRLQLELERQRRSCRGCAAALPPARPDLPVRGACHVQVEAAVRHALQEAARRSEGSLHRGGAAGEGSVHSTGSGGDSVRDGMSFRQVGWLFGGGGRGCADARRALPLHPSPALCWS
jgi:hypothetical protein